MEKERVYRVRAWCAVDQKEMEFKWIQQTGPGAFIPGQCAWTDSLGHVNDKLPPPGFGCGAFIPKKVE